MSLPHDPASSPPTPPPDEATDGGGVVAEEHDHELAVVRQQIASSLFPRSHGAPSQKIGRFVVERRLGAGAMGVVYAAHDPTLDRRVAIKLVRPEAGGDRKAQLRLQREARALAKVSHPNIVAIHEVGEHQGQVFLAMEHVQGQSLRGWQERARRSTSEVLAMYVQAASGLAAAHAAGLVHRDFKPDNVLVDDHGRARVVDFGLVGGDDEGRRAELARWQGSEESALVLTTHTHALVGTPAYMSPEQFQGTAVDARSDQFSFCVALWEALYGERPFSGRSLPELSAHVLAGRLRPLPKASRASLRLQRACERGLSVDPAQRWPSMEALVVELRRLGAPRGRGWIALGLVGGLTVLGGGLVANRYLEVMHRCDGAAAQLEGVWDDARRRAVEDAIVGTGLSYAEDTRVRVAQRLDEYASAWVEQHTEACEATSVRHEQSTEVMDLRMACLGRRRLALREAIDVLAQADAARVENAVELVAGLPSPTRCSDVDALRAELPPPEDPSVAARVEALREQLAHAEALLGSGDYEASLADAQAVVEQAEALGYAPLLAEALWARGSARESLSRYAEAEQDHEQAYLLAARYGHDEVEANAAVSLVWVVGVDPARSESANQWGRTALALAQADHMEDEVEVAALNNIGTVLEIQGRLEESLTHHQRALALEEQAPGPPSTARGATIASIANVLGSQGRLEESLEHHRRASSLLEEVVGPHHPLLARSLNNMGAVLHRQRALDDARAHYERALAIFEAALGPGHPETATVLENIGATLRAQGRFSEALPYLQRALGIAEAAMGPRHPDVASAIIAIGVVLMHQGKLEDALGHFRRALPIVEEAFGPEHLVASGPLINIGHVLREQGDLEGALSHYRRALSFRESALGPEHHDVAGSLAHIGRALLEQGKLEEARTSYERALAVSEAALGPDHPQVAGARRGLGDVLRTQGELDAARLQHERALTIVEEALGAEHPETADALMSLAETALAQHDHDLAHARAERAVSILEASEVSAVRLARARFVLARVSWDAAVDGGADRAVAMRLAQEARKAFEAAGTAGASELAEVERWLAEHGGRR